MIKILQEKKGQALVELAITLPLLLILLMGIIDFGRVFHGYLVITQAAREGARWASVEATDAEILSIISDATSTLNDSKLSTAITPGESYRHPGDKITVSLTYSVDLITPLLESIFTNPVVLQAKTVMRQE